MILYVQVSLVRLTTLDAVSTLLGRSAGRDPAAFGIFFRFQVPYFDRLLGFFSLCHFIFLAISLDCFSLVLCR